MPKSRARTSAAIRGRTFTTTWGGSPSTAPIRELAGRLIEDSFDALAWMHGHGARFLPLYGRQSFEVDGKVRFWGGLTVEAWGGGPGLVDSLTAIAERAGVDIRYGARATGLRASGGAGTVLTAAVATERPSALMR